MQSLVKYNLVFPLCSHCHYWLWFCPSPYTFPKPVWEPLYCWVLLVGGGSGYFPVAPLHLLSALLCLGLSPGSLTLIGCKGCCHPLASDRFWPVGGVIRSWEQASQISYARQYGGPVPGFLATALPQGSNSVLSFT